MQNQRLYALADMSAAEETGVLKLRRRNYPNLTGRGVLFGIADSGIDYTHPVFRFGDGSSRILAIWDQTAERVYEKGEIDEALKSENPLGIVPVTDETSHGTFMTGLAAGNVVEEEGFSGIAPDAQIVVVKLRQAKKEEKQEMQIEVGGQRRQNAV